MKRLFQGFGVLALIALAVIAYQTSTRMAPAICIALKDETGGGGAVYMPAVNRRSDGAMMSSYDGTRRNYDVDASYELFSTAPKHFVVIAHYRVSRDGDRKAEVVDRILPVGKENGDETKWVKVDNRLSACAYFTANSIDY